MALGVALCDGSLRAGRRTDRRQTDRRERQAVTGVTVTLVESGSTARTDADGNFAVADVAPGTYTVLFNYELLAETEPPVTVAAETSRVDRALDWNLSFQESIIVVLRRAPKSGSPRRRRRSPPCRSRRSRSRRRPDSCPSCSSSLPAPRQVTQSGIYDYNLNTRGFNSSLNRRVATLVDGRDPSVPFLGSQEWAAISFPLDDLAQAELVRGPSAALYGANASSGVLNLVTKRPRDSQGGLIRLTGGELSTFNGDFRWAGSITDSTYYKVLGGIREQRRLHCLATAKPSTPSPAAARADRLPAAGAGAARPEDDN
ncbi:MAG: TonB-dependent receptor [Thermoanaerobaculia bacterium]